MDPPIHVSLCLSHQVEGVLISKPLLEFLFVEGQSYIQKFRLMIPRGFLECFSGGNFSSQPVHTTSLLADWSPQQAGVDKSTGCWVSWLLVGSSGGGIPQWQTSHISLIQS